MAGNLLPENFSFSKNSNFQEISPLGGFETHAILISKRALHRSTPFFVSPQDRINKIEDFLDPEFNFLWFAPPISADGLTDFTLSPPEALSVTADRVRSLAEFERTSVSSALKKLAKESDYKLADYMKLLRLVLCGTKVTVHFTFK